MGTNLLRFECQGFNSHISKSLEEDREEEELTTVSEDREACRKTALSGGLRKGSPAEREA